MLFRHLAGCTKNGGTCMPAPVLMLRAEDTRVGCSRLRSMWQLTPQGRGSLKKLNRIGTRKQLKLRADAKAHERHGKAVVGLNPRRLIQGQQLPRRQYLLQFLLVLVDAGWLCWGPSLFHCNLSGRCPMSCILFCASLGFHIA